MIDGIDALAQDFPYIAVALDACGEHIRGLQRLQRRRDGADIGLSEFQPMAEKPERAEQAAAARIGSELAEEGLRVDHAVQQRAEGLRVEKQQSLPLPERVVVWLAHLAEVAGIGVQHLRKARRGGLGLFRVLGIDHRHDQIVELREVAIEGDGSLPPWQGFRKHQAGISADAQIPVGKAGAEAGDQ